MVKTASLNAAPKNHVSKGGVNRPRAIALAARVPTLAAGTVQAVTLGYGYYSDSSAFSVGGIARVEDTNWQVFGTVGYGFRAEKIGLSMGLLWSR